MHDETATQKAVATGVFEQIELCTADGEFVQAVVIPKFTPPPSVLIWGLRLFRLGLVRYGDALRQYHETFYYTVVPIDTVTDNGLPSAVERRNDDT